MGEEGCDGRRAIHFAWNNSCRLVFFFFIFRSVTPRRAISSSSNASRDPCRPRRSCRRPAYVAYFPRLAERTNRIAPERGGERGEETRGRESSGSAAVIPHLTSPGVVRHYLYYKSAVIFNGPALRYTLAPPPPPPSPSPPHVRSSIFILKSAFGDKEGGDLRACRIVKLRVQQTRRAETQNGVILRPGNVRER